MGCRVAASGSSRTKRSPSHRRIPNRERRDIGTSLPCTRARCHVLANINLHGFNSAGAQVTSTNEDFAAGHRVSFPRGPPSDQSNSTAPCERAAYVWKLCQLWGTR